MLPPFVCGGSDDNGASGMRRHQERKMRMLTFWRDGVERQLAAINASISTLQQQIEMEAN